MPLSKMRDAMERRRSKSRSSRGERTRARGGDDDGRGDSAAAGASSEEIPAYLNVEDHEIRLKGFEHIASHLLGEKKPSTTKGRRSSKKGKRSSGGTAGKSAAMLQLRAESRALTAEDADERRNSTLIGDSRDGPATTAGDPHAAANYFASLSKQAPAAPSSSRAQVQRHRSRKSSSHHSQGQQVPHTSEGPGQNELGMNSERSASRSEPPLEDPPGQVTLSQFLTSYHEGEVRPGGAPTKTFAFPETIKNIRMNQTTAGDGNAYGEGFVGSNPTAARARPSHQQHELNTSIADGQHNFTLPVLPPATTKGGGGKERLHHTSTVDEVNVVNVDDGGHRVNAHSSLRKLKKHRKQASRDARMKALTNNQNTQHQEDHPTQTVMGNDPINHHQFFDLTKVTYADEDHVARRHSRKHSKTNYGMEAGAAPFDTVIDCIQMEEPHPAVAAAKKKVSGISHTRLLEEWANHPADSNTGICNDDDLLIAELLRRDNSGRSGKNAPRRTLPVDSSNHDGLVTSSSSPECLQIDKVMIVKNLMKTPNDISNNNKSSTSLAQKKRRSKSGAKPVSPNHSEQAQRKEVVTTESRDDVIVVEELKSSTRDRRQSGHQDSNHKDLASSRLLKKIDQALYERPVAKLSSRGLRENGCHQTISNSTEGRAKSSTSSELPKRSQDRRSGTKYNDAVYCGACGTGGSSEPMSRHDFLVSEVRKKFRGGAGCNCLNIKVSDGISIGEDSIRSVRTIPEGDCSHCCPYIKGGREFILELLAGLRRPNWEAIRQKYPELVNHPDIVHYLRCHAASTLLVEEDNPRETDWEIAKLYVKGATILSNMQEIAMNSHNITEADEQQLAVRYLKGHQAFQNNRDVVVELDQNLPCDCLLKLKQRVLQQPLKVECTACGMVHTMNIICATCNFAHYCSRECQAADYSQHQYLCKMFNGKMSPEEAKAAWEEEIKLSAAAESKRKSRAKPRARLDSIKNHA